MNRKLIIFGGLIMLLVVSLVGIWALFFRNSEVPFSESIRNVLPFGKGGDSLLLPGNDPGGEVLVVDDERGEARFFRLSEAPVAGAISFIKNGSEVVRFADRATGHIYDVNPVTLEKTKIINTTLPKIYEAYFKKDGSGVVYRSYQDEEDQIFNTSLSLRAPSGTSTDQLYTITTSLLRGGIESLAISETGRLAYSLNDTESVVTSDFDGRNIANVWSTPFTKWNISWIGGSLDLMTRPSANTPGYLYSITPANNVFRKILGPLNGLSALRSASGEEVVFSHNDGSLVRLFYKKTNETAVEELASTFAEKCVWSNLTAVVYCGVPGSLINNLEPDLWYQGVTHYADRVWAFDTGTGFANILLETESDFNLQIDVINPLLTPDENYLIFTNKNDLSLWALKLD